MHDDDIRSSQASASTLQPGMAVWSADGRKLGTLVRHDDDGLIVGSGLLRGREYHARFAEVGRVQDGAVHLMVSADELEARPRGLRGPERRVERGLGEAHEELLELKHEVAVPGKVVQGQGALRIHKVVRTELKHFTVPVRREEVVIERVSVPGPGAGVHVAQGLPVAEGRPFEESTFVIPLREERVEFAKSVHVWQEVRVSKQGVEETVHVRTPLRREVVEIEEEGHVEWDGAPGGLHA
jgi:uncharacterized protein (TIGR02271 family)